MEEAVANFAAECQRRLHRQHAAAKQITVFAFTNRFHLEQPQDYLQGTVFLPVATCVQQEIVSTAVQFLKAAWRGDGRFLYKKAGVILSDTCPDDEIQANLFDTIDRKKQAVLQEAIDEIHANSGWGTVQLGVQGGKKKWKLKTEHISKPYTYRHCLYLSTLRYLR